MAILDRVFPPVPQSEASFGIAGLELDFDTFVNYDCVEQDDDAADVIAS